ncbi:hypothetical protein OAK87_00555 [bacterium]|nr:hypothetical protein [bacterium]
MKRWPAAMERLKQKARGESIPAVIQLPPNPNAAAIEWDLDAEGNPTIGVHTTAKNILEPEAFQIDWLQAWAIHAERKKARTGRALADGTLKAAKNAWRSMPVNPAEVTVEHVRDYVTQLQQQKFAPTSIMQRCGLLGGIVTSLIKTGWLPVTTINPFHLIDTTAARTNHHRPATPEEVRALIGKSTNLKGSALLSMQLQIMLGMRIGEVCSRKPEHLVNGELIISETPSWRPKTKHGERTLPVPSYITAIPNRMVRQEKINAMLKEVTGSPDLTSHGLRGAWRTASREAGISTELAEFMYGHSQSVNAVNLAYGEFSQAAKLKAMTEVWGVLDSWIK